MSSVERTPTQPETGHLPASTIAFLHAHRFAAAAKPGQRGTRSLANETVVQTAPLAHMLVKIALFNLHELGAVELHPFDEKRFKILPYSGVRVRLIDTAGSPESIEGSVLAELARDKNGRSRGMDISLLINLLYRDGNPPESRVLKTTIDDAVSRGYATRIATDVGAVQRRLTGKSRTRLEANAHRVHSLADDADRLVKGWNAYHSDQSGVGQRLASAVNEAFTLLNRRSDD